MGLAPDSEALEKRVQQLEEELDFTHAHYHKLLEQVIKEAEAKQQDAEEAKSKAQAAVADTALSQQSSKAEQGPALPPNHHSIQQKRIERLQDQLKAQRQQTAEFQSQSTALAEEVQMLKERQKGATHRQFQAVRRLDAEVVALKSAAALAKHAAAVQFDKAVDAHEQQVLALQAANNKLQLELGDLAQAVPTMLRTRSERAGQQQMAAMALEDRIQAAVERQVAAVSAGHAQELQNVQEQLQQTLDRRTQEAEASTSAHAAEKAANGKYISALEDEVGRQYKYIGKLEGVLECMEQRGCARQLRDELRLLRTSRPADSQEQRIRALKARIAIANRCHNALKGSEGAQGSPRPSTAPASPSARLALLLSQPSEMPPSWATPLSPTTPAPKPPLSPASTTGVDADKYQAAVHQEQAQLIDQLQADVARYKAALQSEQGRSRSLAVALRAKQRLQGQQQCSPHVLQHQQGQPAKRPLTSALRPQQHQQAKSAHVSGDTVKVRPMTACSVLQAKLGSPPSILHRPGSAHTRLVRISSIHPQMQSEQQRPISAKARELQALSSSLP